MSDEFGPKCDPSEFNIHQDKKGQGVGPDVIRTLIGMPAELNFVNVETSSFHCLDGRNPNPILCKLRQILHYLSHNVYSDLGR